MSPSKGTEEAFLSFEKREHTDFCSFAVIVLSDAQLGTLSSLNDMIEKKNDMIEFAPYFLNLG